MLKQLSTTRSRRGFTLVELLVVVAVLGLLAGILLTGLLTAAESAKRSKTRSTIKKINLLLMENWDGYQTRRVPISSWAPTDPQLRLDYRPNLASRRLAAIRELMRLELPQRYDDIPTTTNGDRAPSTLNLIPGSTAAYIRQIAANGVAPHILAESNQSAECLYMIVTLGTIDEDGGRKRFKENEVGDVDGDGMPEFLDAWGAPIAFIRWPAGFAFDRLLEENKPGTELNAGKSDLMDWESPDPFDLYQVERNQFGRQTFAVYPLVVSAGSDGEYGLYFGPSDEDEIESMSASEINDPYRGLGGGNVPMWGTPTGTGHLDNVHNHQADLR